MQTKTEQLNCLFDKWETSVPEYKGKFVRDGIINEELYNKAKHKILFIAKEPNDPTQKPGDFREWWKEELNHSFGYRISEWSYGILNGFPQYDNAYCRKLNTIKAIQSIAFMNIKKIGGGGVSEKKRMKEHAESNFKNIHRQIEIISPEIIITGTSWNQLTRMIFPNMDWRKSGYDVWIGKFNDAKVIDFYHPSSRTAPSASYSLLGNIFTSEKFMSL